MKFKNPLMRTEWPSLLLAPQSGARSKGTVPKEIVDPEILNGDPILSKKGTKGRPCRHEKGTQNSIFSIPFRKANM